MRIPYVMDNQQHRMADVLNAILAEYAGKSLDNATAYFNVQGFSPPAVRDAKAGQRLGGAQRIQTITRAIASLDTKPAPGQYANFPSPASGSRTPCSLFLSQGGGVHIPAASLRRVTADQVEPTCPTSELPRR